MPRVLRPTERSSIHLPRKIVERLRSIHEDPIQGRKERGRSSYSGIDSLIVNPASVTRKILWFSADFGVYKDASGTIPCGDGDSVALWRDRSGNGRNGTLLDFLPTYKVNQAGGYPCLRFNGNQDLQTGTYTLTAPWTFFIVVRVWSTAQDTNWIMGNRAFGVTYGLRYSVNATNWGDGLLNGVQVADTSKFYCFNGTTSGSGSNYYLTNTLLVNGTSVSTTWPNPVIGTSDLGGDLGSNVDIADLLILSSVSDANRKGLIAYYQRKYGVT